MEDHEHKNVNLDAGDMVKYPLLENGLYSQFLLIRQNGKRVKPWRFNSKPNQIMKEVYTNYNDEFKMSHTWFERFYRRKGISLRRKTRADQKVPDELRTSIEQFHAKTICQQKR